MSTVRSSFVRFHVPTTNAIGCAGCNLAIVPPGSTSALCPACQRSQVLADISRTLADVSDLREGRGVFEGLTSAERSEQLVALGLPAIDSVPRFPGFANMPDDALIDIIGGAACFQGGEREAAIAEATIELSRRLAGWQPSPREQAAIERNAVIVAGEPEATRRVVVEQQDPERWDCFA